MATPPERPTLNFEGEKLAFGPIRRDLLATYTRWMNDFETVKNLGRAAKPYPEETQLAWVEARFKGDPSEATFTMYERSTMRPIGNCGLHEIDWVQGTATYGIVIGEPDARGRGYGTEASRLMLDYAFTVLGLTNVMLTVNAVNPAGIRCYEKAGFKHMGRRRLARRTGSDRGDVVYMDALSSELTGSVLAKIFRPTPPRGNP